MTTATHYPTELTGESLTFYIAGPMRGYDNFNFAAFDDARDFLRAIGHTPISPADHDRACGYVREIGGRIETTDLFSINRVMEWDLRMVTEVDAILLLPGWEQSTGAGHERYVAEACGKRIFYFDGHSMWEERPTRLIGLAGYAQSGKDTAGRILVEQYGFERLAFADALKAVLYDLGCQAEIDTFDPVDIQDLIDDKGWEWAKAHGSHYYGTRVLLQRLGIAVREHVDPDAWVKAALRKVKPGGSYVITDVRFPNEVDAILARGGEVWRVIRPGTEPVNGHVSETAIDHLDLPVIRNIGTLEELASAVTPLAA